MTSGVGLITGAAEGTTAAGNASNIDANPITKGVETVTNATVAGVQPGETVTNATATTAGPVVEGVTNASATTGGLEGVTHVEVAVNSTAATAEAKPVEGSTNAAATTAQPNFTGVESSQNSTGTTDVKPTGDASNSTAPEGHLGVANATTTGAGTVQLF